MLHDFTNVDLDPLVVNLPAPWVEVAELCPFFVANPERDRAERRRTRTLSLCFSLVGFRAGDGVSELGNNKHLPINLYIYHIYIHIYTYYIYIYYHYMI